MRGVWGVTDFSTYVLSAGVTAGPGALFVGFGIELATADIS